MKIGFFLQNSKRGGYDTFVIQLLKNWPELDELLLFCNASHPGLKDYQKELSSIVSIIPYNFLIFEDIELRFNKWPRLIRFLIKLVFWAVGFHFHLLILNRIFSRANMDRLLVINGGYPASEVCLAATVAWGKKRPERKAWHNFHNIASPISQNKVRKIKEFWTDLQVGKTVGGFISVSSACSDSLSIRPAFIEITKKYIYNGISPIEAKQEFSIRSELKIPEHSFLLLMLAVYEPRKGHEFVIKVMESVVRKIPQAHLLICGYGNEEEIKLVEKMRLKSSISSNIHLQNHRSDICNLFAQSEILLLTSQSQESFGYSALEAMCCGLPVVVTDVGGLPEVVESGVCGYVVDSQNVDAFALRIEELLHDKTLRDFMGENGRLRFKKLFTAKRMALQYAKVVRN